MACRLFGDKPLPEPMLIYCQLDPWEETSVKNESQLKTFHLKMLSTKWQPFCPGGDELTEDLPVLTPQGKLGVGVGGGGGGVWEGGGGV